MRLTIKKLEVVEENFNSEKIIKEVIGKNQEYSFY